MSFADLVLGDREGYVALAFGYRPYYNDTGKYSHHEWSETRFAWPSERDQMTAELRQVLATGVPVDVYICPAVRFTDQRRKGDALPPKVCWVDLDGDPADPALWDTLAPYVVASGQPGHRHAYVPLTEPVPLRAHGPLNKALADRLGGDHKWSDESLLRMVGTLNHKTDPPRPVTVEADTVKVWQPGELARLLDVDLHADGAAPGGRPVEGEPVDVDQLPSWLRKRLDETPRNRSEAFHGHVGGCKDAGLTQGQTVTVMASWKHLPDRYRDRVPTEVARCWGKVRDTSDGQGVTAAATGNPGRYFHPHEGLLATTLADDIAAAGPLAEGVDDRMWTYTHGVWVPDPHVIRDRAAALLGPRYRRGHVRTVEDVCRANSPTITCQPVAELVNFRNGLLDWRTGTLHGHTPEVLSTVQLPVDYDPAATCPEFDTFLSEVLPADTVELVWELIGYLMYSGNPLHKAVMLTGTGRNGKGTFLRVMTALLGDTNVTSVSLHDLVNTRFTTASLFGKLANIAGDIDGGYLESTATFKAITGGDMISAEHKGRDRFDFTPWAVPVFSANKVPPSSDVTTGYLSRWVVVPFPHDFTGREDRRLDARLHDPGELRGIAAKAAAALPKLLDRGDFELTESAAAARDEFVRRVDQVRTWVDECANIAPGHPFTLRTILYKAYKAWAERDGHKPVRAGEFYDRLDTIPGCHHTRRGAGERGFTGIQVTDPAGSEWWH